jgi:2-polyprenyl-3-methyl-5-hydroxy-6-metoxy-1,4-benzoquinol methylase
MTSTHFFDLFIKELKDLPELSHYYKFLSSESDFEFRKNYFIQRLDYVYKKVIQHEYDLRFKPSIWDLGCGYGTTCLFLAMNGFKTYGSTLEFYYQFLDKRRLYWSQYGDASLFEADYEDVFEKSPDDSSIDIVIVQDTLHHLEPIDEAIVILKKAVKSNGIVIAVEENGSNVVQRLKLYKQRGNKRIISFWDEKLQKQITMGNENIRSIHAWDKLFKQGGFDIQDYETEYCRILPPVFYKNKTASEVALIESKIGSSFLHTYFYFGINFVAKPK